MKSPVLVEIDDDKVTTENVEHILIATKHKNRYEVLKRLLSRLILMYVLFLLILVVMLPVRLKNYEKTDLKWERFMVI